MKYIVEDIVCYGICLGMRLVCVYHPFVVKGGMRMVALWLRLSE